MFIFSSFRRSKIPEYSSIAPNTNTMQAMTQLFIAVNPSALGLVLFIGKIIKYNYLGRVGLYGVVDVYQNKKQCNKHGHPTRNHFGID